MCVSTVSHLQAGAVSWASNSQRAAWTWTACGSRQAASPWSPPSCPGPPLPRGLETSCARMESVEKTCHPRSTRTRRKARSGQLAPFSTAFCLIKAAAACEATSSSRRSVPRANRLLNSLSRTCRACKKRRKKKKKSAQTQSLSAGHPVKLWLNKLGSETDRSRWQNVS